MRDMEWRRIWALSGPNTWARCPVLEAELDLGPTPPEQPDGFEARLLGWLPMLRSLRLPQGPGAFLARALHAVTLELQRLSGSDVSAGAVCRMSRPGLFRVVIEYEEEELARACLEVGGRLVLAALHGSTPDVPAELTALRELALEVRLGPSTGAIVRAARQRGIPVRRLNRGSLVLLGQGARQRRVWTAETDRTSALAETVAQDKELTRTLLGAVGVPVPQGRPVENADDAWRAAEAIGLPVVVKPRYGNHGRGVTTNLTAQEQVVRAYVAACEEGEGVMVERHVVGEDYRLLVVGDRLVAAALREPAHVIGDGRSTVAELVEVVNRDPRRSDGHGTVLTRIRLDGIAKTVLAEQGHGPESIPRAGERVLIRRNANLSTGGTATDVTDRVHPEVAARAVDAARVVGLDVAGVDVVTADVTRPLEETGGAVVEVNAGPGLRMHLEPTAGSPRPVGEAIIDLLFPANQNGRIPVVAVTGADRTKTTRLIAHLLARKGEVVGVACAGGLDVGGQRMVAPERPSGARSARAVLLNPRVTVAVLETACGAIRREGLGFDVCDVAVVTNLAASGRGDSLELPEVTARGLARVQRTVVEAVAPTGACVLNAAVPLVPAMAGHCGGEVVFFARAAGHPVIARHRLRGGRAVFWRGGQIVLAQGAREEVLAPVDRVLCSVETALAAVAAAWALGQPLDVLRAGLSSFAQAGWSAPERSNELEAATGR
jgi:cyanophycin synthetase